MGLMPAVRVALQHLLNPRQSARSVDATAGCWYCTACCTLSGIRVIPSTTESSERVRTCTSAGGVAAAAGFAVAGGVVSVVIKLLNAFKWNQRTNFKPYLTLRARPLSQLFAYALPKTV